MSEETKNVGVETHPSSLPNEKKEKDEAAEQLLMLSDFDQVTKLFRAGLQALGNNETGAIATLNQLLKKAEVLDQETREKILPTLGELKALLAASQEELKQFNAQAQKGLEVQIKEVIANVDFSPIQKKVEAANTQILESTNALKLKAEEIESIANRTKTLGFFASTKYLLVGLLGGACVLYGFFSYREHNFEQKLKADYDAKWSSLDSKFQVLNTQKPGEWNILKMKEDNGREYLQFIVRDNNKQVQCGYVDSKKSGMGFNVSYFNIPIFK